MIASSDDVSEALGRSPRTRCRSSALHNEVRRHEKQRHMYLHRLGKLPTPPVSCRLVGAGRGNTTVRIQSFHRRHSRWRRAMSDAVSLNIRVYSSHREEGINGMNCPAPIILVWILLETATGHLPSRSSPRRADADDRRPRGCGSQTNTSDPYSRDVGTCGNMRRVGDRVASRVWSTGKRAGVGVRGMVRPKGDGDPWRE